MSDVATVALVAGIMLIGLIGILVPVLPDIVLIWLGGLVYGVLAGWGDIGLWLFLGMTVLGAVGVLAEVWVSSVGARVGGASIWGILGGLALGLVGLIVIPPFGAVIGLLLGTFLVEAWRMRDMREAAKGTLGMGVGYGVSFVVKLIMGLGMVGLWVVWLIRG
jgi:uncharacterized protein YqgC (DUF456 family)